MNEIKKLIRNRGINSHSKNAFLSARVGKRGPYIASGIRNGRLYAWGSVGTMGKKVGAGYSTKKDLMAISYNLTIHKPGIKVRHNKFKLKI